MNKLSKILIVIIVLLVIALSIVSYALVKMTAVAKENLNLYFETMDEWYKLYVEKEQHNTDNTVVD